MKVLILIAVLIFAVGCSDDIPESSMTGKIVHVQIVEDGEGPTRESQSNIYVLWDDYTVVQLKDGTRRILQGVLGKVGDEFIVRPNQWGRSP